MSPTTLRSGALLAPVLAACCACAGGDPEVVDGERPIHVVFFLVDTLRADRMGLYGHDRSTSPFVDELAAKECVVFESANAPAPWTLPSIVSLMTSTFLPQHGVVVDRHALNENVPTIATRLRELGYSTGSIYHNPYAGPLSGLDRGFDLCRPSDREVGAEHVREWLARKPSFPFFLYLHNAVPHDPYDPPARLLEPFANVSDAEKQIVSDLQKEYRQLTRANNFRRHGGTAPDNSAEQAQRMADLAARGAKIAALYDAEILHADEYVRRVVEELKAAGVWEDTLFVLLSDHGEELGEHGGWEHDQSLYEELIHVPLIVHFPDGAHAGERIEAPVSLVDLLPTVLDVIGAEPSAGCAGRSLLPLLGEGGGEAGPRVTAYRWNQKKLFTPWKETRGDENLVVREGSWKAIWNVETDSLELYDLAVDPGETRDLSAQERERSERLLAFARAKRDEYLAAGLVHRSEATQEISDEERARLRALGYLSEEEE